MKLIKICFTACIMLSIITGCSGPVEKKEPERSVQDTLRYYLDAMKQQDGLAMAEVTLTEEGFDFSIQQEDMDALGLDLENAQKFYAYLLDFDYDLKEAEEQEKEASIGVSVSTYALRDVLNQAVEEHQEMFGEINGASISEEEKNKQIAEILISSFAEAEKTHSFEFTFHLKLINHVWKIQNDDELPFYEQLFSS